MYVCMYVGMADYQVLPPGLNAMGVKLVDPNDFQLRGMLCDIVEGDAESAAYCIFV